MLVEEIMKTEVITLSPEETIETALKLLHENHIRHLPIVDENNEVIGIVSDRDVRDASPSIFEEDASPDELKNPIRTIMTYPVTTVHPLDFVEEVASIFYEQEIACVPVTRDDILVGIITEKDMLYTLIQLTGTHVQSSQIEVKVINKPGILPQVMQVFGQRKVNISSVLIYPYKPDPKYKVIVVRIQTMNPLPTIEDLKTEGYEVLWPKSPGLTL
ncbi:acetoin utilization protein AcuB [Halobacillus halophilus]|uniref:Acetoin utilization protein AcuB n=1 Tax=Halobacillus halophilus (strain ATCC 35676 / DSM 2266 / JCM 20832 / KCTC 3685 / LMG 17431 / NBRC 102448 / NCIMB 2269) TaxID=866895 RepID=I0JPT0_HALH3|nr:acetoin utilization AcuB family protein [Halobacillus halophilus]ASF40180.1 acetoin utilization protein AcuB [Halobacillus halophilus]CCG46150.1 acetoin utilization protein AcuB [Halobacillus halophilus DSM 2266]